MIWLVLGLGISGLLLCAFFNGAETGFYRATRLRLLLDAMGGDPVARSLVFLTNHPALFVATTLVGTSTANYLISAATVIGVESFGPGNSHLGELLATLALAPVLLVLGELLPKKLFLQAPNRLLHRGGWPFLAFVVLFFPIAGPLWVLGRLIARMVGRSSEPARLVIAERELRRILAEGHEAGILHPAQQGLAQGIFAVARQPIRQFLAPLDQVACVRADMSKPEVLRLAEASHTAIFPVESADGTRRLVGCVRVIDLRLSDLEALVPLRPLPEVSESSTHLATLMQLESLGESMARVVDASGQTLGIVTLDRLREPLF